MNVLRNKRLTCGVATLALVAANLRASAQLADTEPRGPAVEAVLEMPRESAADQLRAVLTLLDLGEPRVAASLWERVAAADLDDEARAALAREFGTARLLRLARSENRFDDEKFFAGARDFARGCLEAAAKLARDPGRLAKLVDDLNAESAAVRKAARVDLAATGTAGGVALLEALALAEEEPVRANLMLALAELRPEVDPLLIAVLADGQGHLRRDVADLAGHTRMFDAVPWLAAIVAGADTDPAVVSAAATALTKLDLSLPNADEARAVIHGEIERLEAGIGEAADHATWWVWARDVETESGELAAHEYTRATIQKVAIARLARALISFGVPALGDRQTELIYYLETVATTGRAEVRDLNEYSTEQLSGVLAEAIGRDRVDAAIACARELGRRADPIALGSFDSRPAPLAAALQHADRDLRFAALEAVMQIAPDTSFAGASGVPTALWQFAAGEGRPQAIAASSVSQQAHDWAGELRGLGYDATPTGSGREALRTALVSPRLQFILVDSDIGRPLVREVIYQLRSTSQTSRVPIAVLSSLANLGRAEQIAAQDDWLLAMPRPHGEGALEAVVDQMSQLARADDSSERRTAQAGQALEWIAELLEHGHPYDELLRDADLVSQTVHHPELTQNSLRVLAMLGTAGSQRSLLNTVSNGVLAIESRRGAADSLATSIMRYGKLLTPTEIATQYDRYNASESADRDTQRVLGRVLDLLEGK